MTNENNTPVFAAPDTTEAFDGEMLDMDALLGADDEYDAWQAQRQADALQYQMANEDNIPY